MARTLELQFETELGGTSRLVVDNPKDPIVIEDVTLAMEQIIAADVFYATTGRLVAVKGARLVDRNVTDYELV